MFIPAGKLIPVNHAGAPTVDWCWVACAVGGLVYWSCRPTHHSGILPRPRKVGEPAEFFHALTHLGHFALDSIAASLFVWNWLS